MKPLIYIAGPYTKPDPATNVAIACGAWASLRALGIDAYCPHWSHVQQLVVPLPWDEWIAFDLRILARCDALYRLPGESAGADREEQEARRLGLSVLYAIGDVVAWLRAVDPRQLSLFGQGDA